MRRADRLFQIIQILRRTGHPVTAAMLAAELEISIRTVYRDMADLIGQRVPIVGEAGLGYVLDADYDMPPLMLTPDEIEAAVLGAQWVTQHSDPVLAAAARDLIAKIAAAVPEKLRPSIQEPSIGAKPVLTDRPETIDHVQLRAAIRTGVKIRLRYRAEDGTETDRVIWPVVLGYAETHRMLIAWCETRQDFRHFRTERIIEAHVTDAPIGLQRGALRRRWLRWREDRLKDKTAG